MAKIVQWNINSYYSHHEFLQELIANFDAEIICLQETNLKNDQTININKFKCYNRNRRDCQSASGGVCILISNHLYSEQFKLSTHIEAIAVKVLINNRMITICNI